MYLAIEKSSLNKSVNSVYLYDDKLVISFNKREECKTVTFKEVNGSSIECFGAPKSQSRPFGLIWDFLLRLKA